MRISPLGVLTMLGSCCLYATPVRFCPIDRVIVESMAGTTATGTRKPGLDGASRRDVVRILRQGFEWRGLLVTLNGETEPLLHSCRNGNSIAHRRLEASHGRVVPLPLSGWDAEAYLEAPPLAPICTHERRL